MISIYVLCLNFLLVVSGLGKTLSRNCIFNEKLVLGKIYKLSSADYAMSYNTSERCKWIIQSPRGVIIKCNKFMVSKAKNCTNNYLRVQSGSTTSIYCEEADFVTSTELNYMTISFQSKPRWLGEFTCSLKTNNIAKSSIKSRQSGKIVGGTDAGIFEFPMMAGLIDLDQRRIRCGSIILSANYILTGAHCFTNIKLSKLALVVGEHNFSSWNDRPDTKIYQLRDYVVHQHYNEELRLNDIAIARMSSQISFSAIIGPVRLPFQHREENFVNATVTLIGWGSKKFGHGPTKVLQKVDTSIVTYDHCKTFHNSVTTKHLCTYEPDKDSCQFDSGGPVLWQNPLTKTYILVGLINYGGMCGEVPSVNLRIGAYLDWIISKTPGAAYILTD